MSDPASPTTPRERLVVVGVDGSPSSDEALRVALEEAVRRDAGLRAVTAWRVPPAAFAAGYGAAPGLETASLEKAARHVLDEAIERAAVPVGLEVEAVVREGHPADVLVDESAGAELLVVGARGHGGFRGMLLGSISDQCAHHARCPILIVPRRTAAPKPE